MIGMLWYDPNPTMSIVEKIQLAADYYTKKYGKSPDFCVVNPVTFTENLSPIPVTVSRYIQPNHFWIGIKDLSSSNVKSE